MIAHLEAVQALLAPVRQTHLIEAVGTLTYPYFLVWPSTGAPGLDGALDLNADLSFLIGVTSVGENPTSAGRVASSGKQVLGPTKFVPLTVTGRRASIKWEGFATANVDRDVTLPNTNRHPAFEAHLYRVESIPA
jgi:hypothetical protein